MRARESERASKRARERENARARERERERASVLPPPISGTAQPRAQEHRCRAGAVCSAVVAHRTISQVRPAQHTVILESLQRRAFYPRPRRPHAAPPSAQPSRDSSPEQRGSTERQLHPVNARPSPRVAGRTQQSIHAGGEKSPPAHGRTGVSPLHALHSRPLDTPRQHARKTGTLLMKDHFF